MVSRYSNELNAFRSGIEERTQQHKEKINAVNQALGIKADKVFENAKKIGDAGSKLLESGIGGGVGATALGKYARKGITAFNKFKAGGQNLVDNAGGKLQEAGSKIESKVGDIEGKVGDLESKVGDTGNSVEEQAARMKSQAFDAQNARDSAAPEQSTEGGANQSVGGEEKTYYEEGEPGDFRPVQQQETKSADAESESVETKTSPADAEGEEGLEIPTIKDSSVDTTTTDATADAGTEVGETAAETGAEVGADVGEVAGIEGTAEGLEIAAGATSWLAFLGIPEVLAAAGGIAGAVGAGYGIADAVKSSEDTTKAQAMPTSAPKTGFSVAGNYVVPTSDSLT